MAQDDIARSSFDGEPGIPTFIPLTCLWVLLATSRRRRHELKRILAPTAIWAAAEEKEIDGLCFCWNV